jgi:2-polyprenyl-3-methyl-5-hydroxy-6-metoxy-1,4-benzoquinol methylase
MSVEIEASDFSRPRVASKSRRFEKSLVDQKGIWDWRELVEVGECVLCSSRDYREVVIRQDGLPIQECAPCGLAFVDPRPSPQQLKEYYSRGYFSGEKDFFHGKDYCLERDKAIESGLLTGYREIVSNFDLEGKAILDIGCASGALLSSLKKHNPKELVGIDSAEYPVTFGRERYDLDLRRQTLVEANLPADHFDLVTLIDVIEHVEDLGGFLIESRRVVKPCGNIFVVTPNYLSFSVAKKAWVSLYQDFEHLQYFSRQSLTAACARAGFRMVKSWTDSMPFRIRPYPTLHRRNLHRLLHPCTALENAAFSLRYKLADRKDRSAGLVLKAVLFCS